MAKRTRVSVNQAAATLENGNTNGQAGNQAAAVSILPAVSPAFDPSLLQQFMAFQQFQQLQAAAQAAPQAAAQAAPQPAPAIPSEAQATETIGQLMGAPVMAKPLNTAPRTGVEYAATLAETPVFDNSEVKISGGLDRDGKPLPDKKCSLKPETRGYIMSELGQKLPVLRLAVIDLQGNPVAAPITLKFGKSSGGSVQYDARGLELSIPLADGQAGVTFKCQGIYFTAREFTRKLQPGDNGWIGKAPK